MPRTDEEQQHSYSLVIGNDPSQVIELANADTHMALDFVQQQLPGREIELFENGQCLGTVKCTRDGYWLILPRHLLMHRSSAAS